MATGVPDKNASRLCFIVESGTDVRLAEGLAERFDLTIVARKILGGVEISQKSELPLKLNVGPPSRTGFARFVYHFLKIHHGNFDHVVVQGYGLSALAANFVGRKTGTSTTMLICSPAEAYYRCRPHYPSDERQKFRRQEFLLLTIVARANAHLGSRYIVLSDYLGDVVRRHGTRRPIYVAPVYGVDTKVFFPSPYSKTLLRERLGLPVNGAMIFFSSRVAPEKDAETLLNAMRRLLDAGRDLWLLHRSGGFESFLRAARAFGVDHRVIATDALDPRRDLVDNYRLSDICIQASREEGLGFSVLEAMACEVPVIAANVGGLKETVHDGLTGWRYSVGNALELANCIKDVLDNPIEAAERAKAARKMVCLHFDREIAFSKFVSAIRTPGPPKVTLREMLSRRGSPYDNEWPPVL
jgi:glycosyltransferase involved in cell wall biosynthesis